MSQLAAEVSRWAGRAIPYKNHSAAASKQAIAPTGLPPAIVDLLVGIDLAIARGDLDSSGRDLHALIGRETATVPSQKHQLQTGIRRQPNAFHLASRIFPATGGLSDNCSTKNVH
jgi:hypothetical protein